MNISNINYNNNNKSNGGFGKNSPVFDNIGIANEMFDPFNIVYGRQRSNEDLNEMILSIIENCPNLFPLISGFYTVFFEKPIDSKITPEQIKSTIIKMLSSENNINNINNQNQELNLNTSNEWIISCVNFMLNIYNCSNDLKKLLNEKKDKLLNHNYSRNKIETSEQLSQIVEINIERLEKSIQDLLIFLSNSLQNIQENISIYFESIFLYSAFIHNVDLLWEIYELSSILISGAKKSDRLGFENVSSFRERLHLFLSSFIKDVGKTSDKTMLNSCWNNMYKVLCQDLILYPQKLMIYNELTVNSDSNGYKYFNLPEYNNQNYIFRFDAKYLQDESTLNNNVDANNNFKEYISGCYGMSFYEKSPTNSKLSFIVESKIIKFITIRLYGMASNSDTIGKLDNINIKVLEFNNDDESIMTTSTMPKLIDQDTIKPLTTQLANYKLAKNGLDSSLVGYTYSEKKFKLNNVKNLIEINFNGKDKKYFLYFIEILASYQN